MMSDNDFITVQKDTVHINFGIAADINELSVINVKGGGDLHVFAFFTEHFR